MLVTEAEAKEKACVQFPRGFHQFRDSAAGPQYRPPRCFGSECMAWVDEGEQLGAVIERRASKPGETRPDGFNSYDGSGSGGDWLKREVRHVGRCGLIHLNRE